jgi:hypothetical protein
LGWRESNVDEDKKVSRKRWADGEPPLTPAEVIAAASEIEPTATKALRGGYTTEDDVFRQVFYIDENQILWVHFSDEDVRRIGVVMFDAEAAALWNRDGAYVADDGAPAGDRGIVYVGHRRQDDVHDHSEMAVMMYGEEDDDRHG